MRALHEEQTIRVSKIFMFLKVSCAHQGCIYLIKNTEENDKTIKLS